MRGRRVPPPTLADREVIKEAQRIMAERPGLWVLMVEHDSWCKSFRTDKPSHCNCQPTERLVNIADELEREAQL